ncbi:tripartite tricarboxylate transporter permease [Spiractinospora alimapuensis]|uniref:tripartite tricarboxylate transporter permease n=1 Tax=Spiractinospora alimapuensis TaxID=2820884 RepID=UPI001F249EF4|nr:tripartite tricarboxylate transporter permease [Spiractinospora alimapuensis]QVQ50052.1 tripartite tricarboxylate transporter permease [Spiractinospora alimapuensis]
MNNWMIGLEAVLAWQPLLLLVVGVVAGVAVGALPGLTATMAVAILLPFTFALDPLPGMMLLLGIYSGAVYAGSIPAILLRLPGTPAAAATVADGHAMARQGRAGEALTIAVVVSCVGGFVGAVLLAAFAPFFAEFALSFGPAEYFMFSVFALTIIASLQERAVGKALIAGLLGMLIATVGLDPIDGYPRFTFGIGEMRAGLDFIPVLVGLFGVAEAFRHYENMRSGQSGSTPIGSFRIAILGGLRRLLPASVYSSLLGFVVGILPGTGGDIGAFVGYNEVRRLSRDKDSFGHGDPRGVAAAESANNAAVPGTLAPTLTLGIPGNATAAVLIGAITVHGLQPGPQLFSGAPDVVYGVFIGFLIIPFVMLLVGLLGIRLWAQTRRIPTRFLWPGVLVLCVIGAFALRSNPFDILVMILAGVLGYAMHKGGFPPAAMVIGLIVGPLAEAGFRRATILEGGGYGWILEPIPFLLLLLSVASLGFSLWRARANRAEEATPSPQ